MEYFFQALAASIWQSALLVLFVTAGLRLFKTNAATRSVIWFIIIVSCFLFCTLPPVTELLSSSPGAGSLSVPNFELRPMPYFQIPFGIAQFILAALIACVGFRLVRLILSYLSSNRMIKNSELPSPAVRAILTDLLEFSPRESMPEVRLSGVLRIPVLTGILRPVILIPANLVSQLTEEELGQIILHETAHYDRKDHWTQLLQRFLEALLFYHPLVFWCGKKLNLDREIACDDRVIASCNNERSYAQLLAKLAELSQSHCTPAVAATAVESKTQLSRRIDMMLDQKRNRKLRVSKTTLIAAALCAGAIWAVFSGSAPFIAVAHEESREMKEASQELNRAADRVKAAEKDLWKAAEDEATKASAETLEQARTKMEAAAEEMQRAREKMRLAREMNMQSALKSQAMLNEILKMKREKYLRLQGKMLEAENELRSLEMELLHSESQLLMPEHSALALEMPHPVIHTKPHVPAVPPAVAPPLEPGTPMPEVPQVQAPPVKAPQVEAPHVEVPYVEVPPAPEVPLDLNAPMIAPEYPFNEMSIEIPEEESEIPEIDDSEENL